MNHNVIVIDQGTHSSRTMVLDNTGNVLATSSVPVKTVYPQPGFVEQSPDDILSSINLALKQLESMLSPEQARHICSAALIVQRSSLLACDKSLLPLTPIVSWQDTRNHALIHELQPHQEFIRSETGLRMNAHYGASKMRWLLDNNSAVRQADKNADLLFVPLAAFIACKLVNATECIVDPVIASRTLLTGLGACEWSPAMLKLFNIDRQQLPHIVPSDHYFGNIHYAAKSIPLRLVGGDQSFIAFAGGVPVNPDTAYVNVGTGAFVHLLDKAGMTDSRLLTSPLLIARNEKIMVAEGTVHAAATAFDWLWEAAGLKLEYAAIELAMQTTQNPPLFINTLTGTGSPHWLKARPPVFVGDASLAEQAVAVIESIVFALMDNLQYMRKQNPQLNDIVIGGGLSQSGGFCQKLANLSGLPVARMTMPEISARGAAWYLLKSQQALADTFMELDKECFQPTPDQPLHRRYEKYTEYIRNFL